MFSFPIDLGYLAGFSSDIGKWLASVNQVLQQCNCLKWRNALKPIRDREIDEIQKYLSRVAQMITKKDSTENERGGNVFTWRNKSNLFIYKSHEARRLQVGLFCSGLSPTKELLHASWTHCIRDLISISIGYRTPQTVTCVSGLGDEIRLDQTSASPKGGLRSDSHGGSWKTSELTK